MTNKEKTFEPFDFYRTGMGFYWTEDAFLHKNSSEKYLKLSDYGISEHDVWQYEQLIKQRRKEAEERHTIYEHRSNFFKFLVVIFLVWLFFFVVGYFNDFMRETGWLFAILSYPVYIGLVWVLYKYAYPLLASIIEIVQENVEQGMNYPNQGHPDGYDARIEKYFNDLLWELYKEEQAS